MRKLTLLVLVACAALSVGRTAEAGSRVALVIGNAAYKSEFARNTTKDAALMAKTLEATGFEVKKLTNANLAEMKRAMAGFSQELKGPDTVSLVYFAGRAVEDDGEIFLIPVDADIHDPAKLDVDAVNLTAFLQANSSRFDGFNIAILDVSRGNGVSRKTRMERVGLALNKLSRRTFIGFATAPGGLALADGKGNSRYTAALVKAIATRGLNIDEAFKRARREVLAATDRKQTPWELSSLKRSFSFSAGH